ncbi:hypothetical protein B566_EDAN016122 [Ephemera danica]|nr:hypothetical protein B566_EDAN016122 [Ephemera danica]
MKRPAEDMEDQGDKFQVSSAASFRLFIGVQQTIPEQEELLSHLGLDQDKITDQHVLYQPDRGNNPRGLTILEVADKETYESVLAMNGGDLKGNTLVIQPARQRDGGGRGGGGGFGRGGRGGGGRGRGDFGSRGGFGGRGGRGGGRDFRGGNRGGGRDFRGGNRGGGRGFGRGGDRGGFRGGNSSFDGPSNKKTRFDD